MMPPLPLNFIFPPSLPKTLSFPAYHRTCSKKQSSQIRSPLDHRDILAPGSQLNFEHSHHWELRKDVGAERKILFIATFSFPAETQNCISKTTIPDSLTVGLL